MELRASAPGKAFVIGEYAVALGGSAVVAALDRRVSCRLACRAGAGAVTLRRGRLTHRCSLDLEEVSILPDELRFAGAALLVGARIHELRGVDLELETDNDLGEMAGKLGLGGSAAVTSAVVAAVEALAGHDPDASAALRRRIATGVSAHRLAQGGGSGADVVACTAGGLVWVSGLDAREAPRRVSDCVLGASERGRARMFCTFQPLELPRGLALELVATGKPVATGPRIARFLALAGSQTADTGLGPLITSWSQGMEAAVTGFRAACSEDDSAGVLAVIRWAGRLLDRLGALSGMPIFTPDLRRACAVDSLRAAVKPSGAGGGDCAVALVRTSDRERLLSFWQTRDLVPLGVAITPSGARPEPTGQEVAFA